MKAKGNGQNRVLELSINKNSFHHMLLFKLSTMIYVNIHHSELKKICWGIVMYYVVTAEYKIFSEVLTKFTARNLAAESYYA